MDIDTLMSGDGLNDQGVAEIIGKVIALLSDEKFWCQGFQSADAQGNWVKITSDKAVSFSISGAIGLVSKPAGVVPPHMLRFLDQFLMEFLGRDEKAGIMNEKDIGWFNDNYDHETMMKFLYAAQRRVS